MIFSRYVIIMEIVRTFTPIFTGFNLHQVQIVLRVHHGPFECQDEFIKPDHSVTVAGPRLLCLLLGGGVRLRAVALPVYHHLVLYHRIAGTDNLLTFNHIEGLKGE